MLEVSKGFEPDGRIFEPPQTNRDNEKPRYLGFLGSMVDPETARSRPWTKGGGIEVSNPCLRVVKNFLRKGRITPLLRDTHDFLPFDLVKKTTEVNPLQAGYFAQPIPKGYIPPSLPPAVGELQGGFGEIMVGSPSPYGNLVGKLALPGEQIYSILIGSENMAQNNVPRGIVEFKSLIGMDYRPQQLGEVWADATVWEMQKTIFPTYPVLPTLLDDLERLLDDAEQHTSLRPLVDDFRVSLDQFRDYAETTIQKVHNEMKESAGRRGYVFRYTSMDLILLEQLGMARQDREIRQAATMAGGTDAELRDMFKQFLQTQVEEKNARLAAEKRVQEMVGEQITEQTMMAASPTEFDQAGADTVTTDTEVSTDSTVVGETDFTKSEDVATYVCDGCQKPFDTEQGLVMHKRRWCEANKKE